MRRISAGAIERRDWAGAVAHKTDASMMATSKALLFMANAILRVHQERFVTRAIFIARALPQSLTVSNSRDRYKYFATPERNVDLLLFQIRLCSCSLSNSQTRRTWRSVVRIFPIESRSVSLSFNFVCDKNALPVAFTPCMIASLRASSLFARTASVSPSIGGQARKQTSAKGTGAIISHSTDSSTHDANNCASRQCSRMRAASPSRPKDRKSVV